MKEHKTKQQQLQAANQDGYSIQHIERPDKDIQLAAVKQDLDSIQFIKNPIKTFYFMLN